jgi:Zn-ribbon RNA-binding protein
LEVKMPEEIIVCISCKRKITNEKGSALFLCPSCGKFNIVRCRHCRQIAAKFTCPECGFVGPN